MLYPERIITQPDSLQDGNDFEPAVSFTVESGFPSIIYSRTELAKLGGGDVDRGIQKVLNHIRTNGWQSQTATRPLQHELEPGGQPKRFSVRGSISRTGSDTNDNPRNRRVR